jgi:hypothetical protein
LVELVEGVERRWSVPEPSIVVELPGSKFLGSEFLGSKILCTMLCVHTGSGNVLLSLMATLKVQKTAGVLRKDGEIVPSFWSLSRALLNQPFYA